MTPVQNEPRAVPYAIANFEELIEGNYYFVDKTAYIRLLEKYKVPVFLRPRRFGKTLYCSILECYYDVDRAAKFDSLFGGLDIGNSPTGERNSCLVLRLNFSKVEVRASYEAIEKSFNNVCRNSFGSFVSKYGQALGLSEKEILDTTASGFLDAILRAIQIKKAPRLFIIIDEYDNFTNQLITARLDSLYHDLTAGDSFLRTFFKVIKSGCEDDSIKRVFITGVLPVTIDDLTSGFNIAQILTLKPEFENMLGFIQSEVDLYLDAIFREYAYPAERKKELCETLRSHYNGYRFRADAEETLYNSTSLNYYLQNMTLGNGRQPRELVDENLRMDIGWLEALAGSAASAMESEDQLVLEGSLPASVEQVASKFSMSRFLDPKFLPVALFYLGQLTYKNEFALGFPNLTAKKIFIGYYNELHRLDAVDLFAPLFQRFTEDRDWAALFAGYWKHYICRIPAQTFDKANENFYRSTFFELCSRYLQRYLVELLPDHPGRVCYRHLVYASANAEYRFF
jgi:hypothetical protein